jgi:hypothetical protein
MRGTPRTSINVPVVMYWQHATMHGDDLNPFRAESEFRVPGVSAPCTLAGGQDGRAEKGSTSHPDRLRARHYLCLLMQIAKFAYGATHKNADFIGDAGELGDRATNKGRFSRRGIAEIKPWEESFWAG